MLKEKEVVCVKHALQDSVQPQEEEDGTVNQTVIFIHDS